MNADSGTATPAPFHSLPELAGFRVLERLGRRLGNRFKIRRESDQELLVAKVFTSLLPAAAQTLQLNCEQAYLLNHPRLVTTLGTGRSGDYFYLLNEFIPGDSLETCLERWRRLPYPQTLDMITALAQALAYGHMHGMHHGRLNPRQILVLERIDNRDDRLRIGPDRGPDGVAMFDPLNVKITGVGLGLPLIADSDPDRVAAAVGGGKPAWWYAAPELLPADGEPGAAPGEASDIFSLGCIFYELLCGTRPHYADTPLALRLRHQTESAALEPLRALDTPAPAVALIGHMLAVDPTVRPSSYDALLEALARLHSEYHAQLAVAQPRRGGTSKRLSPVREAAQLLSAPPQTAKPYRTHFAKRSGRGWSRTLTVALVSSLATAAGILAGMYWLPPPGSAPVPPPPLPATAGPSQPETSALPLSPAPTAAELQRADQAEIVYAELKRLLESATDAELPTVIANLREFEQTYEGTPAALKAATYRDFLEKKYVRLPKAPPPPPPAAPDPAWPLWQARHAQALELAQGARYEEALKRVQPQLLPAELQTTEVLKAAASVHGELYAEVGRVWSTTEREVVDLIARKDFDAALLRLDLVIKTWGVAEFVDKAQALRAKVNTAAELETERMKVVELNRIRSQEAAAWAQQLYIVTAQAKKFQYDPALKSLEAFQKLELKNPQVRQEVAEAIEMIALQKDLLRRINARLDKVKLAIEWKNQRLRITEINEKGVRGRTPETDPDPAQPGRGVAFIIVPWTSVSLPTVYNNLYAYLIDTYQSDEHLMLAVFAHQHGLIEYEDEAAVAAQFGEPAAGKVARVRDLLRRQDARLKNAPAGDALPMAPAQPGSPVPPQGVPPEKPAGLLVPEPPQPEAGVLPSP